MIYWLTARGWQFARQRRRLEERPGDQPQPSSVWRARSNSKFLRGMGAVFLLALAVRFFLGRYGMLLERARQLHGRDRLRRSERRAALAVAGDRQLRRRRPDCWWPREWKIALIVVVGAILVRNIIPPIGRPRRTSGPTRSPSSGLTSNATSQATRSAFGIDQRTTEIEFTAQAERAGRFQASTSRCSTTCASGIGTLFTTPSRSSSPTAPTSIPTPTSIATPSTASCAR